LRPIVQFLDGAYRARVCPGPGDVRLPDHAAPRPPTWSRCRIGGRAHVRL